MISLRIDSIRKMQRRFITATLTLLCLLPESSSAQIKEVNLTENTVTVKDSLEIKKIQLEISELRKKQERSWFNFILTIIGGTTGVMSILWTIYQGVKNYKIQLSQQKLKTISDLLVLLTDSSPNKRVGAANGLSKYSNFVIDELIAAVSNEEVEYIVEAIEKALLNVDKKNQNKIIASNQFASNELIKLLGELAVTNIPQVDIDSALMLDTDLRISLVKNNSYLYDYGKTIGTRNNNLEINNLKNNYLNKAKRIQRTIDSTGRIIAQFINSQQNELTNINISYTELYREKITNISFYGFYAINTLCRHIQFNNCSFKNSIFKGADMFGLSFGNIILEKCNFNGTNMRQSKGIDIEINNCDFSNNAVLSESNFKKLKSEKSKFIHCKMNKFVALDSEFNETKFNSSVLNHSVLEGSTINNCDFFGTKIIDGNFCNSKIADSKFNGADLRGANFSNAYLERVDFSGAELKNIKTENWTVIDCKFEQAKNYNK